MQLLIHKLHKNEFTYIQTSLYYFVLFSTAYAIFCSTYTSRQQTVDQELDQLIGGAYKMRFINGYFLQFKPNIILIKSIIENNVFNYFHPLH